MRNLHKQNLQKLLLGIKHNFSSSIAEISTYKFGLLSFWPTNNISVELLTLNVCHFCLVSPN